MLMVTDNPALNRFEMTTATPLRSSSTGGLATRSC